MAKTKAKIVVVRTYSAGVHVGTLPAWGVGRLDADLRAGGGDHIDGGDRGDRMRGGGGRGSLAQPMEQVSAATAKGDGYGSGSGSGYGSGSGDGS